SLLIKVMVAIGLAVLAGWLTGPDAQLFGVPYVKIYNLIGQLFLNALTLVIVPLVSASIITGIARMGSEKSFGKLGAKAFGYYIGTSALAVLVGLFVTVLIAPGTSEQNLASMASSMDADRVAAIAQQSSGDAFDKISQILYKLVPS